MVEREKKALLVRLMTNRVLQDPESLDALTTFLADPVASCPGVLAVETEYTEEGPNDEVVYADKIDNFHIICAWHPKEEFWEKEKNFMEAGGCDACDCGTCDESEARDEFEALEQFLMPVNDLLDLAHIGVAALKCGLFSQEYLEEAVQDVDDDDYDKLLITTDDPRLEHWDGEVILFPSSAKLEPGEA